MADHKPHPSEELEFVTISPIAANPDHLEYVSSRGSDPRYEDIISRPSLQTSSSFRTRIHTTRSNDDLFHGLSASIPGMKTLARDATAAAHAERRMTFLQGVKLYPKAMGWSILLSMTIVMEGFGLCINNSLIAFPEFRRTYGHKTRENGYQISTAWQSALINAPVAGEIIGLFFNGILTDVFGYRKTMMFSLVCLCLFIFMAFFSFNISILLASQVLCGLPWGVFQTLSTTYAAEVMPVTLRAYLTSNVNLCWLVGQVIGSGVLRGLIHVKSEWSYRVPFAAQWVWGVPILAFMFFAPESPWLLIRQGRFEEAKKVLHRLTRKDVLANFNVDDTVAMIQHTNEVEKYLGNGLSYLDCFKGVDLRRTEIACMVWMIQSLCGSSLTGFAVYFYQQAGLPADSAFDLQVGMYGLAIIGQVLSWFSMRAFGRRTLYMWGCFLSFITLLIAGGIATRSDASSPALSWTIGSMIIIFTFIYDSTIGPVCYSLVAEIPSTRLRVKTVVLARVAYNLCSLATNIIMPKMLNPSAWDWKGKSCFVWAGSCFLCLIWCYYRLPEPKGLTYCELDILFEKGAPARKFRKFQVQLAETGYFSLKEAANDATTTTTALDGNQANLGRMSPSERDPAAEWGNIH